MEIAVVEVDYLGAMWLGSRMNLESQLRSGGVATRDKRMGGGG